MKMRKRKKKGFTLIEVLIAIAVGVLAISLVASSWDPSKKAAEVKTTIDAIDAVKVGMGAYAASHTETFPKTLNTDSDWRSIGINGIPVYKDGHAIFARYTVYEFGEGNAVGYSLELAPHPSIGLLAGGDIILTNDGCFARAANYNYASGTTPAAELKPDAAGTLNITAEYAGFTTKAFPVTSAVKAVTGASVSIPMVSAAATTPTANPALNIQVAFKDKSFIVSGVATNFTRQSMSDMFKFTDK